METRHTLVSGLVCFACVTNVFATFETEKVHCFSIEVSISSSELSLSGFSVVTYALVLDLNQVTIALCRSTSVLSF